MTNEPDEQEPPPRVGMALPAGDLRARLRAALEANDVDVRAVDGEDELRAAVERGDVDVVVIRRGPAGAESSAAVEAMDEDEAPGVVVVSDGESGAERAALLAAGAVRVLDGAGSVAELARSIEVVAEAERTGGAGGPEGRDRDAEPRLADFLSRSPFMRRFLDVVQQVAEADSTLLITGETGVGKERLARAIHAESARAAAPFVSVNCGALPAELLEGELFGHVQGAFTGADKDRAGVFEAAEGGTIFLDEIGEMPALLQVKLLTVLQRREVVRLGTTEPMPVDVRVLAATNREVRSQVERGDFREDLYYRLAVVPLEIPPLRERREDIPDLVGGLVRYFRDTLPNCEVEDVDADALRALVEHDWPGNVRELINAVERAMLLSSGTSLQLRALPPEVTAREPHVTTSPAAHRPAGVDLGRTLKEVRAAAVAEAEAEYLRALLGANAGSMKEAAVQAGISPRALYDRLKRYGIEREDFLER